MAFSAEYVYRIIDQFSGPISRITRKTEQFRQSIARQETQLRRVSAGMRDAGAKMTAGLTLPLVGFGIAAAKTAIDFQDAFTGVQKTVEATPQQLAMMNEQFKQMSREIPVSATELMKIGEAAGQLGIETKNVTSFTKTIALLGATTDMAGEEGAKQLARFANIMQMSQKDFDRLGSTVVALGNNLATSESEIVAMAKRLAPAGHVVKMTEAQVMSLAGALSSIGIEAEAGGTAFSKVMLGINNAISSGGKMLNRFAVISGMSAQQLAASFKKDSGATIVKFINGLQRMQDEGKNVDLILESLEFTDTRLKQALMGAAGAGDLFNKAFVIGSKAWKENNALVKEANLRFKTWGSKLFIAWNKLKLVGNEIGKIIVPIFIKFLDLLLPIVEAFGKLPKPLLAIIVLLGGVASAIGPLLIGLGFIIPALTTLSTVVLPYITATLLPALTAGLASAGAALMSITWPIWLAIAAGVALVAALILAWKKSAMFRDSINNLMDAFSPLTDGIRETIFLIAGGLSKAMGSSKGDISSWGDAFKAVGDILSNVINFIAAMIKTFLEGLGKIGKLAAAITMGEWKDALNILVTGKSKFDIPTPEIGTKTAREKAAGRQDNKIEFSGSIGVSASGGSQVDHARIGLNTGSNQAYDLRTAH